MRLSRGWLGVGVCVAVFVVFMAALTGFYIAERWN
jgi:hypothetical protein